MGEVDVRLTEEVRSARRMSLRWIEWILPSVSEGRFPCESLQ